MIWANVTRFRQNFIAPKKFWAGTAMSPGIELEKKEERLNIELFTSKQL